MNEVHSDECIFCNALEKGNIGNTINFLKYQNNQLTNRILFTTEHFTVIPDLSPIIEGHLLILTNHHYYSMTSIPKQLKNEFHNVFNYVAKLLSIKYQPPVFFEHGSLCELDNGADCISHAHIHALPYNIDIRFELRKDYTELPDDLYSFYYQNYNNRKVRDYIFFQNIRGERFFYDTPIMTNQYLRKLVCRKLKMRERMDYKRSINVNEVNLAVKRLA